MKTSDQIDQLSKAFVAAQAELKNAVFDKTNPHFKSKYATLAGMRDGLVATLSKHGLAVIQGSDVTDAGPVVNTRLVHQSGQWIESAYPIAMDKPQQMGSAVTYARRYSLAAICGIASEEDDDGNAAQQGSKSEPEELAPKPQPYDANPIVRGAYKVLDVRLNQISQSGSLEDLKAFWLDNADTIKGLPAGWRKELETKKDEIKSALTEKAA